MFFTLLSKTVLKNEGNSRVYFYLFLAGIVCYIILHYYLNSGERNAMLQKLNNYFYYIVPIDFAIGAYLLKSSSVKPDKEDDEDEDNDEGLKYSDEQRLQIMKNLTDSKTLKRQHDEEIRKNASPFLKKPEKIKQEVTKHEQEQFIHQQKMMELERQKQLAKQAESSSESVKHKKVKHKTPEVHQSDSVEKVVVKKSKHKDEESKHVDTDLPIYNGK